MKRPLALLTLAALSAQPALATPPACIRPDDARTVLAVALPDAIDALAARCGPALPPDAFLPTSGAALAERYRHDAPVDPERARHAIEAVTGEDLGGFASPGTVMALAHQFIAHAITRKVATRDCNSIDGMVALAAPLRADAMAEAILLALEIVGPDQTGGYAICRQDDEMAGR